MNKKVQRAEQLLQERLTDMVASKGRAFFVPRGTGRRLAISDIHGSFQTFAALLEKVVLGKEDQLFLLGDFMSRGPYSRLTIKYVKSLINEGYQVYPLRGNHEQLFSDFNALQPAKLRIFAERQNALHALKSGNKLYGGLERFMEVLPYYYETDQHLLVHAGFDSYAKKPLKAFNNMLWTRKMTYNSKHFNGKRIIHGHVPHPLKAIKEAIQTDARIWPIDNGCIRANKGGYGRLICIDIDSGTLWKQKNLDSSGVG